MPHQALQDLQRYTGIQHVHRIGMAERMWRDRDRERHTVSSCGGNRLPNPGPGRSVRHGREDDPQVPRQLRQSRHRRPLPAHLPREINRLEPEESCCPECGGELDYLGEVSAEQLELVSSALKVIRTERVKKACTKCDCIVEALAPSRPIERGVAGPGLIARVLTGKYCEHLPLYRQSEIFARQGVELSRALLSNWVDACCQLMTPLNDALYR
ncbi:transposase [Escherichia coli]|nr:transposase [Escherichia coli]